MTGLCLGAGLALVEMPRDALESGAFDDVESAFNTSVRRPAESAAMSTNGLVESVTWCARRGRTSRPAPPASDPNRTPLSLHRKTTQSVLSIASLTCSHLK